MQALLEVFTDRDHVHDRAPQRARLRKAAACLSLVAAPEQDADGVLTAVADLRERRDIRDTLITCLRPAPGEGLTLRPDPVGDHLLLRELENDDGLLRIPDTGGDQGLVQALTTPMRTSQNNPDTASRLITSLLDADTTRWPLCWPSRPPVVALRHPAWNSSHPAPRRRYRWTSYQRPCPPLPLSCPTCSR